MTVEPLQERLTRKKPLSNVLDMDRLCRLLGVDTWAVGIQRLRAHGTVQLQHVVDEPETVDDRNVDCYGWDPKLSEEENMTNEDEERGALFRRYHDAVLGVAEQLFGEHGLLLEPVLSAKGRKDSQVRAWSFRVVPKTTWEDAAEHVRQTINGMGPFYFATTREFLDSGPYTARAAVLSHLGWIPDWIEVYEGGKAKGLVERRMRY